MIAETSEREPVRPLFERYIWDMKQYFDIEDAEAWLVRANSYFNLYGVEPERKIYTLTTQNGISGFALVNRAYRFNASGSAIAELYITPNEQNKGHGRKLANFVFEHQRGDWEVCVASNNANAYKFWNKVISEFTAGKYKIQNNDSYDGKGFILNSEI